MLRLSPTHRSKISAHGEATYPLECCGFLLGREDDGVKVVVETVRAMNARDDSPQNRYLIEPDEFRRAEQLAAEKALDIIGFYHSHPDVAARPSQFDRDHAWPWYSYVIVSVQQGRAVEMFSWQLLDPDEPFAEEPIQ